MCRCIFQPRFYTSFHVVCLKVKLLSMHSFMCCCVLSRLVHEGCHCNVCYFVVFLVNGLDSSGLVKWNGHVHVGLCTSCSLCFAGLVWRGRTPKFLGFWILLHPGLLDRRPAELCPQVHHPHRPAHLRLRSAGWKGIWHSAWWWSVGLYGRDQGSLLMKL